MALGATAGSPSRAHTRMNNFAWHIQGSPKTEGKPRSYVGSVWEMSQGAGSSCWFYESCVDKGDLMVILIWGLRWCMLSTFSLQEMKGQISPSLLFLYGLTVVSEYTVVCFVTWWVNTGHLQQGDVFHSVPWKLGTPRVPSKKNPVLSAEWIFVSTFLIHIDREIRPALVFKTFLREHIFSSDSGQACWYICHPSYLPHACTLCDPAST